MHQPPTRSRRDLLALFTISLPPRRARGNRLLARCKRALARLGQKVVRERILMRRYMPPARRERGKLVVQRLVEQVARQWGRLGVGHQRLGFDRFLLVNTQSLLPSVAAGFVAVRNCHNFRGTGVGERVGSGRTEGVRSEWVEGCLPRTSSANKVSRARVCKLGECVPEQAGKQGQCARQATTMFTEPLPPR